MDEKMRNSAKERNILRLFQQIVMMFLDIMGLGIDEFIKMDITIEKIMNTDHEHSYSFKLYSQEEFLLYHLKKSENNIIIAFEDSIKSLTMTFSCSDTSSMFKVMIEKRIIDGISDKIRHLSYEVEDELDEIIKIVRFECEQHDYLEAIRKFKFIKEIDDKDVIESIGQIEAREPKAYTDNRLLPCNKDFVDFYMNLSRVS